LVSGLASTSKPKALVLAALAAVSGLTFSASTPPIDFELGILLGLIGFALGHQETTVRGGLLRGFVFGFTTNLLALRFVPEVVHRFTNLPAVAGWTALVLLSAGQAVPWAIGGAVAVFVGRVRARAVRPLDVAIGVYSATFVPAIFPWTPAGGLARWTVLIQTSELVGERGTSFVLALACALAAEGLRIVASQASSPPRRPAGHFFALSVGLFALVASYGALRMRSIGRARDVAPHARVALLQPDFDATSRWEDNQGAMMMDRLSMLTKRAEAEGAELTVWPESAYPYTLAHGVTFSPTGMRAVLQQGVRGPVLTGIYLSRGGGVGTNSAVLVTRPGDISPSYDKRHLLWFGETIPLGDTFPVLRRIFARGAGLDSGQDSVAFRTGRIVAAVLNCYEDTLPVAGREAMEVHPNLLVNITNDAWFSGSAEGELHLRLAILRAVETRRDLARAVNRGPTSWVDATGRVRSEVSEHGPSSLVADVALLATPLTLYARAGDLPFALLVLGSLVLPRLRRAAQFWLSPDP
jgi:apolipoprotein N-acyltransferase